MRLLHTSDWHLGRTVRQRPRDDDFDAVLAEITEIAREKQPDLIVHSGDLFDSYKPAAPDLYRCLRALRELSAVAPVVVVAGNHDSPAFLEALDFAVSEFGPPAGPDGVRRLRFVAKPCLPRDGGILDYSARDGQRIRLAALPFMHQNRFLDEFAGPASVTRGYAAQMRKLQAEFQRGLLDGCDRDRDVLVFAAHLYVEGAVPSYTERPVDISDTFLTEADALPQVSYAALGHIHRPQAVAGAAAAARYAGSPLQLDFGEAGEDKSVVVVDADPGRPVRVELVPLTTGRRLEDFTGTLEELRAAAAVIGDAYVRAVIVSDDPVPDLADAARDAAPLATLVSIEPRCAASRVAVAEQSGAEEREPDLPDLFREYLHAQEPRGADADNILDTFASLLADASSEFRQPFGEETRLRQVLAGEPGPPPGAGAPVSSGQVPQSAPQPAAGRNA